MVHGLVDWGMRMQIMISENKGAESSGAISHQNHPLADRIHSMTNNMGSCETHQLHLQRKIYPKCQIRHAQ